MDEQEAENLRSALSVPQCPYCGTTISPVQKISPGFCGAYPCFLANIERDQALLVEQRQQDYRERQEAVRENAAPALAAAAQKHGCGVDDLLIAVMPYQNEPIVPLPDGQRAAFEAHLDQVIDAALAVDPEDGILANYNQNVAQEPPVMDAGCAACQGFCCARGGGENHAFITRQSVYYILQQQPELSKEDIKAHFLAALPEESVSGACVYQSSVGCTLDREWRAGLCNTFHCHDLYAMHDLTNGRTDVPLVVVGIEDDEPGPVGVFDPKGGYQRV